MERLPSWLTREIVHSVNVGSGTRLVIQTHQQSILKTFARSRSGFLIPAHSSALPKSPNVCHIQHSRYVLPSS